VVAVERLVACRYPVDARMAMSCVQVRSVVRVRLPVLGVLPPSRVRHARPVRVYVSAPE